ncbi:MAG: putative selenium-dependent hydroxylase accessory protein YqeC [Atopobiaceae bacterium]|nr:putative selenium-dependent hydroxylase accessory protein YqeC [Atopobiaceae bacterium]
MELAEKLHIEPGITAVIGSGGKTTLLERLAEELQGTVVLATSTRILPFPGIPTASCPPLPERVSCVGEPVDGGKLAAPTCGFEILSAAADHVVVEADGSRGLPLKAHAPWEPVIPEGSAQTILVVGASGFGRPVGSVVHRPEIFCALTGCTPDDAATPELVARAIRSEALAGRLLINQADTPELMRLARELGERVGLPYWAGSLQAGA